MNPLPPEHRLSKNFTVRGFTRSETAGRNGIEVVLYEGSPEHANATELFQRTVQPVRTALSCPLFITSGYRPQELNELVGGAEDSAHMAGKAVDLVSERMPPYALARAFLLKGVPFGQIILNLRDDFVHVSIGNTYEVLTLRPDGEHESGLQDSV